MHKKGDINPEDGRMFWQYSKLAHNGESWVSPDQYNKNVLSHRSASNAWYLRNKDYHRWWARNNRHKKAEYAKRYRSLEKCRIVSAIRARIRQAIKLNGKGHGSLRLLGCSVPELKVHISSMFKPGMSWDNWGLGTGCWHIDHILPCAAFDLSNVDQQKACFNWTNLQPLWAEDNLRKGDRYEQV